MHRQKYSQCCPSTKLNFTFPFDSSLITVFVNEATRVWSRSVVCLRYEIKNQADVFCYYNPDCFTEGQSHVSCRVISNHNFTILLAILSWLSHRKNLINFQQKRSYSDSFSISVETEYNSGRRKINIYKRNTKILLGSFLLCPAAYF